MQILILAAGVGSRLGNPVPKPLTPLSNGETIMGRQIGGLRRTFPHAQIMAVVGFKKGTILESHPEIAYAYNPDFGETNTSKSLLRGLSLSPPGPVLWLNGDVVFDDEVMQNVARAVELGNSFVVVNTSATAEEEVKYTLGADGAINALSKQVADAEGEAVGINFIAAQDRVAFEKQLDACEANDYFERGMEYAIEQDGVRFAIVDISGTLCMEIDFSEDLSAVNDMLDNN